MSEDGERVHRAINLIHGAISDVLGLQRGRKSDLSPIALSILYAASTKVIRMHDVAELYDIKKSTASRYVDGLEKKGLITRRRGDADGRVVFVEPTTKGLGLIKANEEKLSRYVENGMAKLTPAEQELLVELLGKFTDAD